MSQHNIRIKLQSFTHSVLTEAVQEIVACANRAGAQVKGPIPLPRKIEKYTVNRSPHVNKKAREQFEIRTYRRVLEIVNPTPQVLDALSKLELSTSVDVDIKK